MRAHPIEAESMRILDERVDLTHLPAGARMVVARVVHASADLEYARTVVISPGAIDAGVAALRAGAPVVTDTEAVRHSLTGVDALCYLHETGPDARPTRSAAGMCLAAERHPGAVVVVGCSPTALGEVVDLARRGCFAPALVVGLPVGFVGAAQAKAHLRASGLPSISNVGDKGGSAVAAAALNAIVRMAGDR